MRNLTIFYDGRPCYEIRLADSLCGLSEMLSSLFEPHRKLCIVTDSNVAPYYAEELAACLSEREVSGGLSGEQGVSGFSSVFCFIFPAGEENKTLASVERFYEFLIAHEFDRKDVLVALGGGVVGDMTGFAAATYLRGIRFVQVPTTLLAMVDSSIGGKTGVDLNGYKNMIGAFHQPSAVFVSTKVLQTLDRRQIASGMGEVIKHGLIRDASYVEWLFEHVDEIRALSASAVGEMVYRSQQIKKAVVEADPKEQGERALLNFGHTIGHAIEKALRFERLHGECVALGTVAAVYLSIRRGALDKEELTRVERLLTAYGLPVREPEIRIEDILENCVHDKKKDGRVLKFILLERIGAARIATDVSEEEIRLAAAYVKGGADL